MKKSLETRGITVTPAEGIPEAFWIDGYDALDEIPEFEEGILYVQDISSMMVAKTGWRIVPGTACLPWMSVQLREGKASIWHSFSESAAGWKPGI